MPPRRKNRATTKTAPAATPSKQQQAVGAIRTSPVKRRRSSVQGGKSSTSRLQPSEPLHMTTRGAAKAASTHTSPVGPSPVDGPSRRSSINGIANLQDDHSDSDDGQPKHSRELTDSGSPPKQMGSQLSQPQALETESSKPSQNAQRTVSKPPPKQAGKKRRAPNNDAGDAPASNAASNNNTAALANGVTRSESDLSEKAPRRKKRKTQQDDAPQEPADAPPELTDASTPPGSPEAIPEVGPAQALQNVLPNVNGEIPAKAAKRLPGRRRQPHSNVNVETNLRRQLELKMNYRSLAKVHKTILEELSKRTLENLKNDSEYHKQTPEYIQVMSELDERLKWRMDQLNSERQLKLDQLERVRIAEEHIQKEQFINRFKEFQENFILQAEYRLKQLERQIKAERSDLTDDEEHIVEPTHMQFPKEGKDDRLGSLYASRSRAYVETKRMIEDEEIKQKFEEQRKAFLARDMDVDEDHAESLPDGFATFTGPDRAESLAHYGVASLVDAAMKLEAAQQESEPAKVIPNEQADALFLLASLSAEQPQEALVPTKPQQTVPNSQVPSPVPSRMSSQMPSQAPSRAPSRASSRGRSRTVSRAPSRAPSRAASQAPSRVPSRAPSQVGTPVSQPELQRPVSPEPDLSLASAPMSIEDTSKDSSVQPADGAEDVVPSSAQKDVMDICLPKDKEVAQEEEKATPEVVHNGVSDPEEDALRKVRFEEAREQAEQIYIRALQSQFAESDVDSHEEQDVHPPIEKDDDLPGPKEAISQSQGREALTEQSDAAVEEQEKATSHVNDTAVAQSNGAQGDATEATSPEVSTPRVMEVPNSETPVQEPKPSGLPQSQTPTQDKARRASPLRYTPEQVRLASPLSYEGVDPMPAPAQDTSAAVHTPSQEPSSPWLPSIENDVEPEPRPDSRHSKSPAHPNPYWSSRNLSVSSDSTSHTDAPNPLDRLKSMLDKRSLLEGETSRSAAQRNSGAAPVSENMDRPQSTPTLAGPFSPAGNSSGHDDGRRTSVSGYNVSPSVQPAHVATSPHDRRPSNTYYSYQHGHEQSAPQMDHHRRMSGSHIPPSHSGSPTQPYAHPAEYGRPGSNHSAHHSPYGSHPHPHSSSSNTLPARPPAPPSQNFRFAYHEPAPTPPPPRAQYGPRASYPPPHQGPPPYTAAPAYPPHQPYYQGGGYVPPPGSFQAPPPPPPAPAAYPPLSIKQYPGPPAIHPRPSPQSRMYTVNAPPPPHNHPVPPPPAPPVHEPRRHEVQPPKRRPYRAYHEPGTQFRTYQGPNPRPRRSG